MIRFNDAKRAYGRLIGAAAVAAVAALMPSEGSAQSIGAPQGVTYTVVSTSQVTRANAARCGYNDLSMPNMAVYTRELREYTQYSNGRVVRTWRETAEVFDRCYLP